MNPDDGYDPGRLQDALNDLVEQAVTRLYLMLDVEDAFSSGPALFDASQMRERPRTRTIRIEILPEEQDLRTVTVASATRQSQSSARSTTPELAGDRPQDFSGYRDDPTWFTRPYLATALVEETDPIRLRRLQMLFDEQRTDY